MQRPDNSNTSSSPPPRGASASGVSWKAIFIAWRSHHALSASSTVIQLLGKPFQSLMTALVIGITLSLPALFGITLTNLETLGHHWEGAPRLSLFIRSTTTQTDIQHLAQQLSRTPNITQCDTITPEQGLAELQQRTGVTDLLELLGQNPLPTVLVVTFTSTVTPDELAHWQTIWQALPAVESVEADLAWVKKLQQLLHIGKQLTIGLAALLGIGAVLSVSNTIRLAIENSRSEIVVAKLVGATDAYVRRPFLYTGFWYGLAGGCIATALVTISCQLLATPIANMAILYDSPFRLQGATWSAWIAMLSAGTGLGMLGAWLGVSHHLHAMRPR